MASQSGYHSHGNLNTANLRSRLISKEAFVDGEINSKVDLIELKLPSVLRIQNEAFDPRTYQVEDPIIFKNDKGVETEKVCMIEDIIRWRVAPNSNLDTTQDINLHHLDKKLEIDQSNHSKVESNTKIVQWSDGSYSLAIGDEFFEINMENLTNRQFYAQFEKFLLYKGSVNKKMIVKPPPKSQKNHQRFIKRINESQQKVQQAQITVALKETKSVKQLQRVEKQNISTSYQTEREDVMGGRLIGAKRTMEQVKADLEGVDFDDQSHHHQGFNGDHLSSGGASKRPRQGGYDGMGRQSAQPDRRYGGGDADSNFNQSYQSNQHQHQPEEEDDGEEFYQGIAQIENKTIPLALALPPHPKPISQVQEDNDSDDDDDSDSSEEEEEEKLA